MNTPDQPEQPNQPEQTRLRGQTFDPDANLGVDRELLESVDDPARPATPAPEASNAFRPGGVGRRIFILAPHPGLLNDAEIKQFVTAIREAADGARQVEREGQDKQDAPQGAPQEDAQTASD
jgi:hypothetical protein